VASTQPNMQAISYSLWWSAATLELRTRNLDSHNPLTLADRVAPENVHLDKRPRQFRSRPARAIMFFAYIRVILRPGFGYRS
jgi:hypothetical protein